MVDFHLLQNHLKNDIFVIFDRFSSIKCLYVNKNLVNAKLLADGKILVGSKHLVDTTLFYLGKHLVDTKHLTLMKMLTDLTIYENSIKLLNLSALSEN